MPDSNELTINTLPVGPFPEEHCQPESGDPNTSPSSYGDIKNQCRQQQKFLALSEPLSQLSKGSTKPQVLVSDLGVREESKDAHRNNDADVHNWDQ